MQHSVNKLRIYIVLFIVVISFSYNLFRLYKMQVIDQKLYQIKATAVSSRSTPTRAPRGEIYDRHYDRPYVDNSESFSVIVNPASVDNDTYPELIKKLAFYLEIEESEIESKLPYSIRRSYKNVEIRSSVTYDKIVSIAENIEELPGVSWESIPIRNYSFDGSISHILGYVGKISSSEFQVKYNEGYTANDDIGKNGVEKQYDIALKGKSGLKYKTVDVKGRKLEKENIKEDIEPEAGKNLRLTIDRNIQKLSEKALGKRKGSVIVLKPHTGEILAMVSYPSYEASDFNNPNINAYGSVLLDEDKPLLNRAIQGYAPASTFKVIMSAAVLEEAAVPEDFTVECTGRIYYGDRFFHCWNRAGHGVMDLQGALENSCNIYYFTVGRDYLGIDKINTYAREFGFSQNTGLDLPNEATGQVPTMEWVKKKYDVWWTRGDTMNVSIGQGRTLATPLQVANQLAFVLNGGVIYKPHVVKEIIDPVTGASEIIPREIILQSSYSEDTFIKIKSYMRGVITDGTAKNALSTKAVEIAAKTGTGQVGYKEKFHDWFISYGPYDAPVEEQYVMVVMIEASNEIDKWRPWAPKASNLIYQGIFADQTFEEVVQTLRPYYLRELF